MMLSLTVNNNNDDINNNNINSNNNNNININRSILATISKLVSQQKIYNISILIVIGCMTIIIYYHYIVRKQQRRRIDSNDTTTGTTTTNNNSISNNNNNNESSLSSNHGKVVATKPLLSSQPQSKQRVPNHIQIYANSNNSSSSSTLGSSTTISNTVLQSNGCIAFQYTNAFYHTTTTTTTNAATTTVPTAMIKNTITTSNKLDNNETEEFIKNKIRRDRAKVLSSLLSLLSTTTTNTNTNTKQQQIKLLPPKRGSTIIISIDITTISCTYQRYILYLLGTFYNVFIIFVLPQTMDTNTNNNNNKHDILQQQQKLRNDCILSLRGNENHNIVSTTSNTDDASPTTSPTIETIRHNHNDNNIYLSNDIIPDHRIVASTTIDGRVAFCRQMIPTPVNNSSSSGSNNTNNDNNNNSLILDYDPQVQHILHRFGYQVILYNNNNLNNNNTPTNATGTTINNTVSPLGQMIL